MPGPKLLFSGDAGRLARSRPGGWYKVSFRVNMPGMPPVFPGQPAVHISPKYLDPDKTPLAVEVVDSPQPGAYDLKLSAK